MEFSDETLAVMRYLDEYTDNNLRKRNDLAVLMELSARLDAADEFNQLAFESKCCWKVYTALRRATPDTDAFRTLEKEFSATIQSLRERLLLFAANASQEYRQRITETYLGLGSGILRNLVDLAHDLGRVKDLQNDHKRTQD